jgi:hypothetical protein
LIDCQHRHVVFTIPKELRNYFAHDRKLLKLLFDAAAGIILYAFNKRNKSEDFTPGMACVLYESQFKFHLSFHMELVSVLQLESLHSAYKHWAKQIKHFFRREALKCTCGHYFEFVDIYPRKKSNKWSPSTVII